MNKAKDELIHRNLVEFAKEMAEQNCCIDTYPQQYRDGFCFHCRATRALNGTLFEYWDWKYPTEKENGQKQLY